MKVSIIGGGGRVGSDAAYALQIGGIVREIALVDMNAEMAAGEALDLRHGSALTASQTITSGGYEVVDGSDCVVITAGLRRKPDESRLELINRNVGLFKEILKSLKGTKLPKTATILVVSNPVDILTELAGVSGIIPQGQVLGLGTVLDTCRFRSLLADRFNVGARDVHALILGEHGDSMVPILSSATVGGVPLSSVTGYTAEAVGEVFDSTRKSGAEVIRLKGGAGRAVGVSIKKVVEAIALDSGAVLPVSAHQEGKLGISGISLSMPTRVGRAGVLEILEPSVTAAEKAGLEKSASSLKDVWKQIQ
ncbi:MAG: lactate/malate dehydrogenase family protein [Fimbriimonas ginsengisoli]|uniref:Lactate/malate dehydrogenase family protein n=1 Tax=Fimbriimonas ginsengisoli TaxID=1005039 RepID=A0A931PVS7_FIMGI|nr:lactate/malate dehydrogenase family protein [Fimbriimonas ginsengisoli]